MRTSSARVMPAAVRPNSNFVSAMMMPLLTRVFRGFGVNRSDSDRASWLLSSARPSWYISSKEMFSSCPVVALVAGVKIGSGSLSDSLSPVGRLIPQTLAGGFVLFPRRAGDISAHHALNGKHFRRATIIERPRIWSAYFCTVCGILLNISGDQVVRNNVFQELEPEQGNLGQHPPLCGMPVAST